MQPIPDHNYKIILAGESGAGKSTFFQRCKTGEYKVEKNEGNSNANVCSIFFQTSKNGKVETIRFELWDFEGHKQTEGSGTNIFGAHGAILMVDASDIRKEDRTLLWTRKIWSRCPNIPI